MAVEFQSPPQQHDLVNPAMQKKVSAQWFDWFKQVKRLLDFSGLPANQAAALPGITVTITTAALTGGGAQGSMVFTNGILTAQTQAT